MLLELGRDGSKVHTLSWAYCGKYDVRRAGIGISRSRRSVLCIKHNHLLVDDLFRRFLNRFEDTMYHIYPQLVVLLSKYLYVPVALYPSFGISFVAHGALACILWSLDDSSPANTSASPIFIPPLLSWDGVATIASSTDAYEVFHWDPASPASAGIAALILHDVHYSILTNFIAIIAPSVRSIFESGHGLFYSLTP